MSSIQPKSFTSRTGQQFAIRTAQPDDAATLLAYVRPITLEAEVFLLEADEFPATDEEERQWIQDHLNHPGKLVLVAVAEGTIIGNVSFENGANRRSAHRGSFGVAVAKSWRGQGVGTALLETLLEWAGGNPIIEKVNLEVFATNETAIRLYRKLGFVQEGLRPREIKFGPGRYADALLMHKFVKQG